MPEPTPMRTDAAGQKQPGSGARTTWVVSARTDDRVALWEPETSHPGGEAFVAGKVPDEVALTPEVTRLLRIGELREATEAEIKKRRDQLGEATVTVKGPWD